MIAPQAFGLNRMFSLDWDNGLMLCESLALVFFFLAACWGHERISRSTGVRRAALIAALCLAIENVRMAYGTFRGVVVIRSSSDSLAWKYHPFIRARYILVSAFLSLAVISILIFFLVVWRTSLQSGGVGKPLGESRREYRTLRVAALLAVITSIVAIGELLFAVIRIPSGKHRASRVGSHSGCCRSAHRPYSSC